MLLFFFFSSRRRHTRWPRDWSSDVCSSDLRSLNTSSASGSTLSRIRILNDMELDYTVIVRVTYDANSDINDFTSLIPVFSFAVLGTIGCSIIVLFILRLTCDLHSCGLFTVS